MTAAGPVAGQLTAQAAGPIDRWTRVSENVYAGPAGFYTAEALLDKHPREPELLLALGRIALRNRLCEQQPGAQV